MREDKNNKWRNIFRNNVSGRVISCFSRFDWVLGNLYKICAKNDHLENKKGFLGKKKDPIGLNKINLWISLLFGLLFTNILSGRSIINFSFLLLS